MSDFGIISHNNLEQQVGVASNDRQQVVEIMGHTSRQPSNGLDPLGSTDLLLQLSFAGYVALDANVIRDPPG